mmetsp:Transcript_10057/g.19268  ORF Transcript_10057/g.19268 Transcript_10057/m.19268 type:complete len:729 (+) Transcript_10057:257-2443(+)
MYISEPPPPEPSSLLQKYGSLLNVVHVLRQVDQEPQQVVDLRGGLLLGQPLDHHLRPLPRALPRVEGHLVLDRPRGHLAHQRLPVVELHAPGAQHHVRPAGGDALHPERAPRHLQVPDFEQPLDPRGRRPVGRVPLLGDRHQLLAGVRHPGPVVRLPPGGRVGDVRGGQRVPQVRRRVRVGQARQRDRAGQRRRQRRAPQLRHRLLQHLHVEVQAELPDAPSFLLGAQDGAGPTDVQVSSGHLAPAAQRAHLLHCRQPHHGIAGQSPPSVQEIGVRIPVAAPHTAAQLVQLRETQHVCVLHHNGVHVGDVQAVLDDRRRHQHVRAPQRELHDHVLGALHLPVAHGHTHARHQLLEGLHGLLHHRHPGHHVEHLAVAVQLVLDGLANDLLAHPSHRGGHVLAPLRRCVDGAHVPQAAERHLQRAWDRRGREGQHVHVRAGRLELLLLRDAETLLLVHHHQPQPLEGHLVAQEGVRAHHHLQLAGRQPLLGPPVLPRVAAAQALHGDVRHAAAERAQVLRGQHGGGRQQGHLPAVAHRAVDRPHGHLGLAEADVPADEAVHGALAPHHVLHHRLEGRPLVRRGLEVEPGLERPHLLAVRQAGLAVPAVAVGVEHHDVLGQLVRVELRLLQLGAPAAAAGELGQLGVLPRLLPGLVPREQLGLAQRQRDLLVRELEQEPLAPGVPGALPHGLLEPAEPVVAVHQQVALVHRALVPGRADQHARLQTILLKV